VAVTPGALLAYAGALALLVITPGPVVAALIARAATGGVGAAVPLAAGVAVGDVAWPLLAMLGIGVIAGVWADFLVALRFGGAAMLVWMGVSLVRKAEALPAGMAARESAWAGFTAGLMVIAGNPKAILFYMGVLPGFFDFRRLSPADMALICLVSALVPFVGNLAWAALFARARRWLADPVAMRRTHVGAGLALVAVGVAIAVG
jgi:threonine/homoserine/homoserine lactone efflux protein